MAQLSDFNTQTQEKIMLIANSWGTTAQYLVDNHYNFCVSISGDN